MKRLIVFALIGTIAACTPKMSETTMNNSGDKELKRIHDAYVVEFLRRNPTVNTYLGGAGLDPSLKHVDGTLRDHSSSVPYVFSPVCVIPCNCQSIARKGSSV